MNGRTGRRGLVALLGLAALAAACTPVAPPPPPPPPTASAGCSAVPGTTIPGQYVATVDPDGGAPPEVEVFEAATPTEKAEEVAQLDADGTVLAVEPDRVVAALDTVTPGDDPLYAQQGPMLTEAGFTGAWTAGFAGTGQTVAVIDSGVQAGHEDLAGKVLQGADLVSGSTAAPQGTSDYGRVDAYGHGTHVAGIIAAADNTKGGIGGAPLAQILPVRVLNSCGSGSMGDVATGIQWAADHGAHVINLSLGGGGGCGSGVDSLQAQIDYATSLGVTVVAAAGNSNSSNPLFPAACDNVLAVGATQGSGVNATRASFSNYGSSVDIAAPGVSIPSTFVPGVSTYKNLSGTSMATPFVSAAAALVYQRCANPASATVQQILVDSEGPVVPSLLPHSLRIQAGAGTFTLTLDGQTTAPVAFDAPAATVATALEALSNVGVGNVTVAGGPGSVGPYAITFLGAAATNLPLIPDSALADGAVALSVPAMVGPALVQTATITASAGTFTLTFAGGETTTPLAYDASAATVQAALEALPSIGAGNVSVSLGTSGGLPQYSISFLNGLAGPPSAVTADAAELMPIVAYGQPQPFPGRLDAAAAVAASCT